MQKTYLLIILSSSLLFGACSNNAIINPIKPEQLADCPATPNCVSSNQQGFQNIEPLHIKIPDKNCWEEIVKTVSELPRTTVIINIDGYLKAEVRTLIFRFTDDLELLLAADGKTVHIRSASRLGYSDMGTNGRRIVQLRKILKDKALIEY